MNGVNDLVLLTLIQMILLIILTVKTSQDNSSITMISWANTLLLLWMSMSRFSFSLSLTSELCVRVREMSSDHNILSTMHGDNSREEFKSERQMRFLTRICTSLRKYLIRPTVSLIFWRHETVVEGKCHADLVFLATRKWILWEYIFTSLGKTKTISSFVFYLQSPLRVSDIHRICNDQRTFCFVHDLPNHFAMLCIGRPRV